MTKDLILGDIKVVIWIAVVLFGIFASFNQDDLIFLALILILFIFLASLFLFFRKKQIKKKNRGKVYSPEGLD